MQLSEDKTSIIKNRLLLPDIPDRSEKDKFKDLLIGFFKRHPNYENKIDWNKARILTKSDFDEVLSLEGSLSGEENAASTDKDILEIFKSVNGRKFEIVGENSRWLFVAPLNWEAAVYCDSSKNQGGGARWCIGRKDNNAFWYEYVLKGSVFVMAFNKGYRNLSKDDLKIQLKYMIERKSNGSYHVWNQIDTDTGSNLEVVGSEKAIANGMFKKAKEIEAIVSDANANVESLIASNVKNGEIKHGSIPYKYRMAVGHISFPDNVVVIPSFIFMECARLKSVVIGKNTKRIDSLAFDSCLQLESVEFPIGIEDIGPSAFNDCHKLKKIVVPESAENIGDKAFHNCTGLKSVEFKGTSLRVGPEAFSDCSKKLVVTVPKDFDRNCIRDAGIPETATFRILDS